MADPESGNLAERRLEETEMVASSGKGEEDPRGRDWEEGKEWPPEFPGDGRRAVGEVQGSASAVILRDEEVAMFPAWRREETGPRASRPP